MNDVENLPCLFVVTRIGLLLHGSFGAIQVFAPHSRSTIEVLAGKWVPTIFTVVLTITLSGVSTMCGFAAASTLVAETGHRHEKRQSRDDAAHRMASAKPSAHECLLAPLSLCGLDARKTPSGSVPPHARLIR